MKVLNDSEYFDTVNYIKGIKNKHRIWIELAMLQGWRENEIAELRWEDIVENGKIKSSFVSSAAKKDSKMPLKIHKDVRRILKRRIKEKGKVFQIKGNSIYKAWRRHQIKIWGVKKFEFHDLRRTAVTRFYLRTEGKIIERLEKTKKFARHQDMDTTILYIFVGEEERKELWLAVRNETRKKKKSRDFEKVETKINKKEIRTERTKKIALNEKEYIINVFKERCKAGSFQHQKLYFELIGVAAEDLLDQGGGLEASEITLSEFLDRYSRNDRLKAVKMIRSIIEGTVKNWEEAA